VFQTEFHPAFAFVEADGGAGDEGGFLEEDFLFLAVFGGPHGHGVHKSGLAGKFRLFEKGVVDRKDKKIYVRNRRLIMLALGCN